MLKDLYDFKDMNIPARASIALGMFDGMHAGHRMLIQSLVDASRHSGCAPCVLSFSNHPSLYFGGGTKVLMTPDEKTEALKQIGVERVLLIPFDEMIAHTKAEDFLDWLCNTMHPEFIFAGFNYTFGENKAGTPKMLYDMSRRYGYEARIIEPVRDGGEVVSSSRVREAVSAGRMEEANKLLARPYRLNGTVVRGNGIGKTFEFPTANVTTDPHKLLPPDGVYATWVYFEDNKAYPSVTNIGVRPTVEENGARTVETYISGLDADLYGMTAKVEFIRHLRPEMKFNDVECLVSQMKADLESSLDILGDATPLRL